MTWLIKSELFPAQKSGFRHLHVAAGDAHAVGLGNCSDARRARQSRRLLAQVHRLQKAVAKLVVLGHTQPRQPACAPEYPLACTTRATVNVLCP